VSDEPEHPVIPGAYWAVEGKLLAGPYPGTWDREKTQERLARLLEAGITFFVDLTQPGERESYEPLLPEGAHYQRRSIRDMYVPAVEGMRDILDTIDAALSGGHVVYVHCWGGIGRTGTVVGCYFVRHGLSGDAALQKLERLRSGSPETVEQRLMVYNWREAK
jgi:protein-tyrosine phosphatase